MNVSKVSASRSAGPPHRGHGARRQAAGSSASGDRDSSSATGSSASGAGTSPQSGQCSIGTGQPQRRWRDTLQSCRR